MPRAIANDWHAGAIPDNVQVDPTAYIETSYSFELFRSQRADAACIRRGAAIYLATMFDVGARGRISIGEYTLLSGARIICDEAIEFGSHCLVAWNVVLMDTYRVPAGIQARRGRLVELASRSRDCRRFECDGEVRPIRIGSNVWIGFDSIILPGVSIGEGSIVGARSVVFEDVPPYTVAAGNPARFVRRLAQGDSC